VGSNPTGHPKESMKIDSFFVFGHKKKKKA
jgi:hypothetical protein